MLKLLDKDFKITMIKTAFKNLMEMIDNMHKNTVNFSQKMFSRKC